MPIYEYECKKCGEITELILSINGTKPKTTKCKNCQGRAKAIISQTSFVLKGRGWYKDGYEKKKKPKATETTPVATTPAASTTKT
jgi:putative FmdB family regulatory protein